MASDRQRQLVDRYFAALNAHDYAVINDLILRPFLARNIQWQQGMIASILSDVQYSVDSTVSEGDEIWAFCHLRGVHTGAFETPVTTIEPTQRDVTVEQISRFRIAGDRIDMVVDMTDLFGLVIQMTT